MMKPPSVSTSGGTLGNDDAELARGDVEGEAAVDLEAAVGVADDGGDLLGVLLVLNLAHHLLDQILERDDAGEGVAGAEDDRDVDAAALELAPQPLEARVLRGVDRLAHELAHPASAACPRRAR